MAAFSCYSAVAAAQPQDTKPPSAEPSEDTLPAAGEDEEFEDEEFEEEEMPDPSRAAPPGRGVIWGVMIDAATNDPMIEAEVGVVGTDIKTITDLDGQYRFELPPGNYRLRVWYPLYKARIIEGVEVRVGELSKVDDALQPNEGAVDEFVVEVEPDTSSLEGQLLVRKNAAAVGDSLGRAEMSKSPDRNAAQAAKRVVGATIVGGRFVYVRGLGQRYTNALLDGAPLPSPEPDQQTIPLDLFPSTILDGLTIAKGFTPDSPGDFAGGSVRIATRRVPDKFTLNLSLSTSFNTQSTFRQGLTYGGGSLDWLGIDDGTRSLPSTLPDYKLQRGIKRPDGSFITRDQIRDYGRSINTPLSAQRTILPPNHRGSVVVGYGSELDREDRKLGFMAALTYSRNFMLRPDEVIRTFGFDRTNNTLIPQNDLSIVRSTDRVRWGALGSVTFEWDRNNRFYFTGLQSVSSDNEAREIEGFHEERGANIHETRLLFVSRRLTFGQLRGSHTLTDLWRAEVDWNLSYAFAARSEPDRRSTVFEVDSKRGYVFEDDSQSGLHFFSDQSESSFGGGMNWTQPLSSSDNAPKLKFGSLMGRRHRTFSARSLGFQPTSNPNPDPDSLICPVQSWSANCPNRLFPDQAIGPVMELNETTRGDAAYDADLNIYAGYAMLDATLADRVRIVLGQRVEASEQTISSFDPFLPEAEGTVGEIKRVDLMPAISATFNATDSLSLRSTIARTIARPQLRELAPFAYIDFFGAREVQGEPDLNYTGIINADIRVEWFPSLREVLAMSVFYKNFTDPIERVVEANKITFQNADGANLMGIEFEARKNFGFISPVLADLSLVGNATFARSQVLIAPGVAAEVVTNTARPLANQAPYILNFALDYDNDDSGTRARILYNIAGPRLVAVGLKGIDDVYQQPRHLLDITASQRLGSGFEISASARNLINDSVRRTHGTANDETRTVSRFRTGTSFSLGARYRY